MSKAFEPDAHLPEHPAGWRNTVQLGQYRHSGESRNPVFLWHLDPGLRRDDADFERFGT